MMTEHRIAILENTLKLILDFILKNSLEFEKEFNVERFFMQIRQNLIITEPAHDIHKLLRQAAELEMLPREALNFLKKNIPRCRIRFQ